MYATRSEVLEAFKDLLRYYKTQDTTENIKAARQALTEVLAQAERKA